MLKIESYEQIQSFVQEIRQHQKGFVTNFYWDANKHPYWIADGSFLYERGEEGVILIHQNETFSNLFYMATSLDVVSKMLDNLPSGSDLVTDLVCRGDGAKELKAFKEMGFTLYKSLYRMCHVGQMAQADWEKDHSVELGTKKDTALVFQHLQRDFDPLCEQLPSQKEVEDYAEKGQLWVIKDEAKLCGFLIAELNGVTWYLRYWYTSSEYRNLGIGAKLLRTSLVDGINSKRQIFWVISDNENAIKRYEHFGFKRENMNDYVMIKRKQI